MKLVKWRIASQVVFLTVFLWLFRITDYTGSDTIPTAVNVWFRVDPLIAASVLLASKRALMVVAPSIIVVLLTLVFGRVFCGWVCPLGTLLDLAHRVIPASRKPSRRRLYRIKYFLLIIILAAAAVSFPLVGFFDPFSLLVRGLTLGADPALHTGVTAPFDVLYIHLPDAVSRHSENVYDFLKGTLLPYRHNVYRLSVFSLCILAAIFLFEFLERRFWCRNICPLGALLGILSRFSLLKGEIRSRCRRCDICRNLCRMDAIDDDYMVSSESCILCWDCVEGCTSQDVRFRFRKTMTPEVAESLSRRAFLASLTAGLAAPLVVSGRARSETTRALLIRPPGAIPEDEFLQRCVRCGECMKVCIGNALHPTFLEAGFEGMFSPILVPRIGYCEYECTLCGQVCPTGAIETLAKERKKHTVIGIAYIDKNRCLPYQNATSCIVCQEHCPIPGKAIRFHEVPVLTDSGKHVMVKQPYVIENLCIGCGICETRCPVPGPAAIRVLNIR